MSHLHFECCLLRRSTFFKKKNEPARGHQLIKCEPTNLCLRCSIPRTHHHSCDTIHSYHSTERHQTPTLPATWCNDLSHACFFSNPCSLPSEQFLKIIFHHDFPCKVHSRRRWASAFSGIHGSSDDDSAHLQIDTINAYSTAGSCSCECKCS